MREVAGWVMFTEYKLIRGGGEGGIAKLKLHKR